MYGAVFYAQMFYGQAVISEKIAVVSDWTASGKPVTVWTGTAKGTASWNKVTKPTAGWTIDEKG